MNSLNPGTKLIALASPVLCLLAETTKAETAFASVSGDLEVQIKNYLLDHSCCESSNELMTESELALAFEFSEQVAIQTTFKLEPVYDHEPGYHRTFGDHGAFIEELFLYADYGRFSWRAGKYNVSFGVAFDNLYGVFGDEISKQDYELAERVGVGGEFRFGNASLGQFELASSLFVADTTELSRSILTDRGRLHRSDGGPSNTSGLESYAVSLDVENLGGISGLKSHVAYRHQGAGIGDADDEDGFAFALFGEFTVSESVAIHPFVEFVSLDWVAGLPEDLSVLTLSSTVGFGSWRGTVTYIDREVTPRAPSVSASRDRLLEVTYGYEFESGLSVDLGYMRQRAGDWHTDGVVAKLVWQSSF